MVWEEIQGCGPSHYDSTTFSPPRFPSSTPKGNVGSILPAALQHASAVPTDNPCWIPKGLKSSPAFLQPCNEHFRRRPLCLLFSLPCHHCLLSLLQGSHPGFCSRVSPCAESYSCHIAALTAGLTLSESQHLLPPSLAASLPLCSQCLSLWARSLRPCSPDGLVQSCNLTLHLWRLPNATQSLTVSHAFTHYKVQPVERGILHPAPTSPPPPCPPPWLSC